jgi:hypothetical protein
MPLRFGSAASCSPLSLEGRVYRPLSCGLALTGPAGTSGARGGAGRGDSGLYRDARVAHA